MGWLIFNKDLMVEVNGFIPVNLLTVDEAEQHMWIAAFPHQIQFSRVRNGMQLVYIEGCIHDSPDSCPHCTYDYIEDIKDPEVFSRYRSSVIFRLWRYDNYVVGNEEI